MCGYGAKQPMTAKILIRNLWFNELKYYLTSRIMKNFILFKRQMVFVLFILLGGVIAHADDNLITEQVVVKLDKAGTLFDKIGSTKMFQITSLKIIGEINGTDLELIRMMAGCDRRGEVTSGKLSILDLSEVAIIKGGGFYYEDYETVDDVIGDYAFLGCSSLASVSIPSSITSIGYCSFSSCGNLTSVSIPSSVTSIGDGAFSYCGSLTSASIPSSVTSIGRYAFLSCSNLASVTLPSGLASISDGVFQNCSSLASVTLPSSVTSIGGGAFAHCN